ncbi:66_t:CDS:10 [Acaulospora morrowiae]|uniref:66_t:CDS:1 n=1 Tax=Acaulospora morrowiae TaxID=94023 RepID=A0A9N9GEV4_9GLOM|nr:66_t:CDS:10 [Acaulospora morrowiae]
MERNQEEGLPIINSPVSPSQSKHSFGSGRNVMQGLQFTSIESPNVGFGSRSYISSMGLSVGARSYSASPLNIRSQSLALGDLELVSEDDKKNDSPVDSSAAGQSNLSLLLQKSKTPSPPDLQVQSQSQSSNNSGIPQLRVNGRIQGSPSNNSGYDPKEESRPLLEVPFSNYGNRNPVDDLVPIEENHWTEKSWFEWLPCVGGRQSHLHNGEEPSRPWRHITPADIFQIFIRDPISYLPAVFLGLLLNLLDAISYGLITFPVNNAMFSTLGPDGISMFFVSCIVSQLVYSGGFSKFGGGNGSMMIEVVPFLHIMAEIILKEIGNDKDAVISTTILSFAISSVLTGLVFLLLGALKLGSLIEFFPRHILDGCIGGVGWFLVATAIEVSAGLKSGLGFNYETLIALFNLHSLCLWGSALMLALLLRVICHKIHHALVVPYYFMITPLIFYLIVYIFQLDWGDLRDDGWVFKMPAGDAPWYRFYTYYDFSKVDWSALLKTVPAMFALTFFGILHVPINVPTLGISLNEDNVDTNRELVAHGVSNLLSGLVGSVQNYLVYTNSLLFYRSGGDNRVAGLMLAAGTTIILLIGPWIVGYVPVMVVGALIFHLGIDLMKEALVDTWGVVNRMEYFTITAIVIAMATLGFIEGILLGIIMACIFFVVSNSRRSAIRATFSGSSVTSIVRRRYRQQKFLKRVGNQIYVMKLQGYMFFGTINGVENAIRQVLTFRIWRRNPISFLIVDFSLVTGLDYSAAKAFVRIHRILEARRVHLVICGVLHNSESANALAAVGIWGDTMKEYIQFFENFNEALERCENMLLEVYYNRRRSVLALTDQPVNKGMAQPTRLSPPKEILNISSPRNNLVQDAGKSILRDERPPQHDKPTSVLIETFQDNTDKNEEFFSKLAPYFHEVNVPSGEILWNQGDSPNCLYLVDHGVLRVHWRAAEGVHARPVESILPGTLAGELGFFTKRKRDATLYADQRCVLWQMKTEDYDKLLENDPKVANDFMRLALHFSAERLSTMMQYAFLLAQ